VEADVRFRSPDGSLVHLSYCSNVHPAEAAEGVVAQLDRYAGPVRRQVGAKVLGVGLWLSAAAACTFERDIRPLREALVRNRIEVVTLNGFPYGGFHDPVVKHAVYQPDWTTTERAEHTLRLARLLSLLLPDDVPEGSVSTLPLGYREPWSSSQHRQAVVRLQVLGEELARIEERTGRRVLLAVEPEPGCVLETTSEVAALLEEVDRPHVQACLDTAHMAVQFEDPATAVKTLAGRLAKAQVASALHVDDPVADRTLLEAHDEPRFLHQTRQRDLAAGTDDLADALAGGLDPSQPWRAHVHLPLHVAECTTQDEVRVALHALVGGPAPVTRCLEVETYTWTVLPEQLRPRDDAGLVAGLAAELRWTREQLLDLGLEEA
jgi:sugar phosphate isomerase/epimerase